MRADVFRGWLAKWSIYLELESEAMESLAGLAHGLIGMGLYYFLRQVIRKTET